MITIEFIIPYTNGNERCQPGDMIDVSSFEVKDNFIECIGLNLEKLSIPTGVAVIRNDNAIVYCPKTEQHLPERFELIA